MTIVSESALCPEHAQHLRRFRIPPEVLEAARIRSVNDADAREMLGINGHRGADLTGILFPYLSPTNGERTGGRIRLDHPLPDDGGRYISEPGCRHVFFPPLCGNELSDSSIPAVIVEAEKSALVLAALAGRSGRNLLVIAVGGVWGWKRRSGVELTPEGNREPVTAPSPSLDLIVWNGRKTILALDSNVGGRRDLEKARLALAEELQKRGAEVFIASTPRRDGINGPDDLVAVAGDNAALEMLDRAAPFTPANAGRPGFVLTRLAELLIRPDTPVDYVLENRLVAGTVSLVVSKPKVGKSTLARNLCLAIGRGESFLEVKTKRGECIYLALEEREEDVRSDFRAMGADGSEPILIHAAPAPAEGIWALCDLIRQRRPVLVTVDPLFRLAHIRDEKAYAETYAALGPLIDVARTVGTHVLLTHHAGKSMKLDAIDSPLGSTAIGGAVCTLLVMRRTEAYRTILSVQRIGPDMPETVLKFDVQSRRLSLNGTRFEADRRGCEDAILAFLGDGDGPRSQEQIREGVEGKTRVIRAALTALAESGRVLKTGDGKRGKPFLYEFPNSGSQHKAGTREPESENGTQPINTTEHIPVPDFQQKRIPVPDIDQVEICEKEGDEGGSIFASSESAKASQDDGVEEGEI